MAHYAFLDENNIVTEVIVGKDENQDGIDWEQWYSDFRGQVCKRTSYNGNIRKNFAGIGYTYQADIDAFVPPKPYPSWILDANAQWKAPIDKPFNGRYSWDEVAQTWVEVNG